MGRPLTIPRAVPEPVAVEQHSSDHAKPAPRGGEHVRGLLLIGLFKLGKASLAVLSGFAAYHLTHTDPGELAMNLVSTLHLNPMGRPALALLDQADTISTHGFRQLGALSFVLAALYLIEGGGLMLQKVWAEYLTVVMTAGAMPWELYELTERYTHMRLMLLILNAAVVLYLALLLAEKRRKEREFA